MKKVILLSILFLVVLMATYGTKFYFKIYFNKDLLVEEEKLVALHSEIVKKPDVKIVAEPDLGFDFPMKIKAPELVGLENWLNSEPIESLEALKGKVVYLKFWTYSCINCIHTFPHVQKLHESYEDDGLVVLGIHTPEFQYERKIANVRSQVEKNDLTFPVVQDNEFETWRAYNNRYWPALYLIDKEGYVRYTHFGQGNYEEIEQAVQALLKAPVKS